MFDDAPKPVLYAMSTPSFNVTPRLVLLFALADIGSATSAFAQSAAAAPPSSGSQVTARPPLAEPRIDAEIASATAWGPVQVVIYKSKRSLALYHSGSFDKEYPVVLGLVPKGRKRHANDARTPEGLYRVVGKRAHDRWQYFLALDYPNAEDRKHYEEELGDGTIPDEDGKPFGIGDSIGIHGNDRAADQASGVDWTKGCIALTAKDVAEIAAKVPVGTPVWIVE